MSNLVTQKLEYQKSTRFEMRIDEGMLWQMRQLAVEKRFPTTSGLVRAVLKQYINSELKTVKAEAAKR